MENIYQYKWESFSTTGRINNLKSHKNDDKNQTLALGCF